jgi:hypothetical protein
MCIDLCVCLCVSAPAPVRMYSYDRRSVNVNIFRCIYFEVLSESYFLILDVCIMLKHYSCIHTRIYDQTY